MRYLIAAAALAALPLPASAESAATWPAAPNAHALTEQQLLRIYQDKLKPLRAELIARRAAEGGELSPASLIEFQRRLDALNADFRRFVRKQDVFGYDAWGDRAG